MAWYGAPEPGRGRPAGHERRSGTVPTTGDNRRMFTARWSRAPARPADEEFPLVLLLSHGDAQRQTEAAVSLATTRPRIDGRLPVRVSKEARVELPASLRSGFGDETGGDVSSSACSRDSQCEPKKSDKTHTHTEHTPGCVAQVDRPSLVGCNKTAHVWVSVPQNLCQLSSLTPVLLRSHGNPGTA